MSGWRAAIKCPTGFEDVLLKESRASDAVLALELFGRLVQKEDENLSDFALLPAADGEALLLAVRRMVLGDVVQAEARCNAPQCGARVDIDFRIGRCLAAQRARRPRDVEEGDDAGWFGLAAESLQFRLPTCADLIAVEGEQKPYSALVRRCIAPAEVSGRLIARVERAMQAMAPRCSQSMVGKCPECERDLRFYFDVHSFVLRELRNQAAGVYQDVHLLAFHYKWCERQILEMPRARRVQYVEMIRDQGVAA